MEQFTIDGNVEITFSGAVTPSLNALAANGEFDTAKDLLYAWCRDKFNLSPSAVDAIAAADRASRDIIN